MLLFLIGLDWSTFKFGIVKKMFCRIRSLKCLTFVIRNDNMFTVQSRAMKVFVISKISGRQTYILQGR